MKTNANAATQHLLSQLWQKNLPQLQERLNTLAALPATPTPAELEEASSIAHKLAGSLGMFGYPKGTEVARQIEVLLVSPATLDHKLLHTLTAELRDALPPL